MLLLKLQLGILLGLVLHLRIRQPRDKLGLLQGLRVERTAEVGEVGDGLAAERLEPSQGQRRSCLLFARHILFKLNYSN